MNHLGRVVAFAAVALSVVAVDACHHAPPPLPPAPKGPDADSAARANAAAAKAAADAAAAKAAADAAAAKAAADAAAAKAAADAAAAKAAADAAAAKAASDAMRATLTVAVHYDYDKSELRDDAKAALDAKIPILRANTNVTLRIAGNTDDRGSNEYNLALGQRRAVAAKQYLVDRGISETRLETISYGEERKLCSDEAESCYSQNRRSEFEITAGGSTLKKP